MNNNIFIDFQNVLSYNALLNFIIAERGVGKTYGSTKFSIKQFLKKGDEFAYLRRYKSELNESKHKLFNAINQNNEFPKHNLYNKGNTFYCNDKVIGYGMTLSTAQNLKSTNFNKVKNIIFDEFIPQGGKHYLKDEVYIFLNLIETIARLRDVRVFLLGNADDIINPYFLYFNLSITPNTNIATFKNGTILINYVKNEAYREVKRKTRFGELVSGTPFEDYAIDNQFINYNTDFIEKKSKSAKFQFSITYKNITYGVWFDYKLGKIYISYDYQKNSPFQFVITLDDFRPNTMLLKSLKRYNAWKMVQENYQLGNVRFDNMKCKLMFEEILKLFLI